MKVQERIIELQTEIQALDVNSKSLFEKIKDAMRNGDTKTKLQYKNEKQYVSAKLVGLRAEMQYLQNYGKDY